jgi:hypothetical protein
MSCDRVVGADCGSFGAPIFQEVNGHVQVVAVYRWWQTPIDISQAKLVEPIVRKLLDSSGAKSAMGRSLHDPVEVTMEPSLAEALALARLGDASSKGNAGEAVKEVIAAMADHLDTAVLQTSCCRALSNLAHGGSHNKGPSRWCGADSFGHASSFQKF